MNIEKQMEKLSSAEAALKETKTLELLKKADEALAGTKTTEKLSVEYKTIEELSSFKLGDILKITGRMLGIGKHKNKFYKEEDLKWAVEFHKGKFFPIKVDHKDKEVGATIGRVDTIYWDDVTKAIIFEGHINDITQSRNILDKVVTDVSATIAAADVFDPEVGVRGTMPEFKELSLVESGAYKGNTISVV